MSQIKSTTLGAGQGGQAAGNRVVRWERRGDRVFLPSVSYEITADAKTPIARGARRQLLVASWQLPVHS